MKSDLADYKFFCFNGKPEYCQVILNRSTNQTIDFYDMDWNLCEFTGLALPGEEYPHSDVSIRRPQNLDKMKEYAKKLSRNTSFVRIDFYEVNEELYFGEITFYPASGFGTFVPEEWNVKLGKKIRL